MSKQLIDLKALLNNAWFKFFIGFKSSESVEK